MSGFLKRLFYYGIGLGLGILIVSVLFGDRNLQCSYFPNDRVLSDFRKKEVIISPYAACLMECQGLEDTLISDFFREGRIDFSKSIKKEEGCNQYFTELSLLDEQYEALFENCTDTVFVLKMEMIGRGECICPSDN